MAAAETLGTGQLLKENPNPEVQVSVLLEDFYPRETKFVVFGISLRKVVV